MNFIEIKKQNLAIVTKGAGQLLVDRIIYSWQEDLCLRRKWKYNRQNTKELYMKEICFLIDDEQIELLHPTMEEEPKCKVIFGQGNLETLSLVLKFKLTDMKVAGTMRIYNSTKPCKSSPYELILKDVQFEIIAGLLIRGDSFYIENFSNEYINFNVNLSCKNKDESNEIFLLNKIQDLVLRKSIEKYIMDKLGKDIITAIEDRVSEECADTSVCMMLDNEFSYRNLLRLHKKRMLIAFQKLIDKIIIIITDQLETKKLTEITLPDLYGKLLLKDHERGTFRATEGSLNNLASLRHCGHVTVHQDGDIILFVPLFFSYLNIVYKHLSMKRTDEEQIKSFETPENSNSSHMKIKIQKINNEKVNFTLLDFKVDDLGYVEINWDSPESDTYQISVEPEFAMWLNYTLEYTVVPIIEERIKTCLIEALKNDKLSYLALHQEDIDIYDSDPLEDEEYNETDSF